MTKAEEQVIRNVIARLRCDEGTHASDYVVEALTGKARPYLDSWVIGALECLLPGEGRDPGLALKLSSL